MERQTNRGSGTNWLELMARSADSDPGRSIVRWAKLAEAAHCFEAIVDSVGRPVQVENNFRAKGLALGPVFAAPGGGSVSREVGR